MLGEWIDYCAIASTSLAGVDLFN